MKATHTTLTLILMFEQISPPSYLTATNSTQIEEEGVFLFIIMFHELESKKYFYYVS